MSDAKHSSSSEDGMECICGKSAGGRFVLPKIHHVKVQRVALYVDALADLTLIDVGSGSGAVLASILEETKVQFNHFIALDPNPESFSVHGREEQLRKIVPLRMTVKELVPILRRHNLTRFGLLICWPDPECEYDYEAIRVLQPVRVVLLVGYHFAPVAENGGRVSLCTHAGGASLWNALLVPISSGKTVFVGTARYRLVKSKTITIKNGKQRFFADTEDAADVATRTEKEKHLYSQLFLIERVDDHDNDEDDLENIQICAPRGEFVCGCPFCL